VPPGIIALAADHAGYELKCLLKRELGRLGYGVLDLGTDSAESVDYPDYANKLAEALREGRAARGVLVCGTGVGMAMAANRHRHIRAVVCHSASEARLTRQHNDANVLALGQRMIGTEIAKDCLAAFLNTEYEGGRHATRVAKFS